MTFAAAAAGSTWGKASPYTIRTSRGSALPERYLTDDLPGIGGTIKQRVEDFLVEEIPLYAPRGTGQHTFFEIRKEGIPTFLDKPSSYHLRTVATQ